MMKGGDLAKGGGTSFRLPPVSLPGEPRQPAAPAIPVPVAPHFVPAPLLPQIPHFAPVPQLP